VRRIDLLAAYRANSNSGEGLQRSIFDADPDTIAKEIAEIGGIAAFDQQHHVAPGLQAQRDVGAKPVGTAAAGEAVADLLDAEDFHTQQCVAAGERSTRFDIRVARAGHGRVVAGFHQMDGCDRLKRKLSTLPFSQCVADAELGP
jgi:hypothetical protein